MHCRLYQSSQASTVSLACRMVSKRSPCSRSTFSDPNSVSVTALTQQLPLRLIEARMPCFSSTWRKSSLAYADQQNMFDIAVLPVVIVFLGYSSHCKNSRQKRNQGSCFAHSYFHERGNLAGS